MIGFLFVFEPFPHIFEQFRFFSENFKNLHLLLDPAPFIKLYVRCTTAPIKPLGKLSYYITSIDYNIFFRTVEQKDDIRAKIKCI